MNELKKIPVRLHVKAVYLFGQQQRIIKATIQFAHPSHAPLACWDSKIAIYRTVSYLYPGSIVYPEQ
jgi:hypothetical protein